MLCHLRGLLLGHRPPQQIGLAQRVPGDPLRDLQNLILVADHAERLFRNFLQLRKLVRDLGRAPERLGVGGVPAALPVCAAVAAATERLVIASAVLPLPLHHPLRVAEDVATVDGIANGRFELGIGLGADRGALAGFGLDAEDRAGRFEEAIAILRAAWGDGPIHHVGRHFDVDGIEVFPKPARPGGPPLWIGARAESALRRAARLDLGALVEVGTDVGPYLDECEVAGSSARVAVTGAADRAALRAREIAAQGRARVDLWVEVDPAEPDAVAAALAVARDLAR